MDYGQLLTDAWQIVWRNKFLFILGFLAALAGTGSSSSNNFSYTFNVDDLPPGFGRSFDLFLDQWVPIVLGLFCLIVFVTIAFWLISLTAQAGLISAAARLEDGEKVSFGEALGAGVSKLGRMIGIYLLLYGPFILLVIIIVLLAFLLTGSAIGYELSNASEVFEPILASIAIVIACVALLFCILLPLLLVVMIILPFAQRAAILEDHGVTASIGRAWGVIKSNLGEVAILVLIFLAISIGYGIVVAMLMLPLAFLAFAPMFVNLVVEGSPGAGNFLALVCGGVAVGLLAAVLNALWTTYRSTIMTLAYRRLVEKAPE
ncbi:MAG: hypothetical protein JSW55_15615 [Chloroflexota bacterium]|nr:MAG: hypothetical protein JSW55_15615 [Chloroflexota bacterium]